MWPTLFEYGSFQITTFGLMMFVAFITAGILLTKQFRWYGLEDEDASNLVLAAAIGGILGAKIYYAILYRDASLLLSRAGLVWYGGLIGGVLAVSIVILRKHIDYFRAMDAGSAPLALGYGIGRIGCFLVGDDYGRPTDSAIGMAFPKGSPPTTAEHLRSFGADIDPSIAPGTLMKVHPTQLYEAAAAFVIFAVLLWHSRRPHRRGRTAALFLIFAGIERILVEFVRAKDDRFLGPFTVAQLISLLLILLGSFLFMRAGEVIEPEELGARSS